MDRAQSIEAARSFCCLRYEELPDIGLYLEQVLTLINSALAPIQSEPLTGAMISNYVKNKALPAPVRKKYGREHLAYLMVTCMLKQVFTVSQITRFFEIQRETYPLSAAYNFFATEYENALRAAFEFTGEALPCVETKRTEQTILIRAVVLAATNRVYAEKVYF
ncbi:MAG: DUF1836 domain-containing protein [Clostridia bacterium]|nr:DUF1836 domain-containing protein [Clostridia bacterium]MBQ3078288.1 DUF1836 domain-containing protein [Clostridia bacterium]